MTELLSGHQPLRLIIIKCIMSRFFYLLSHDVHVWSKYVQKETQTLLNKKAWSWRASDALKIFYISRIRDVRLVGQSQSWSSHKKYFLTDKNSNHSQNAIVSESNVNEFSKKQNLNEIIWLFRAKSFVLDVNAKKKFSAFT